MGERTIEAVAAELARHSVGLSSAGETFTWERFWEDVRQWPPDMFAFTSMLLGESGAYVRSVAPPMGATWPPSREWLEGILPDSGRWVAWSAARLDEGATVTPAPPSPLVDLGERLSKYRNIHVRDLVEDAHWDACTAILHLHALADEACVGLGLPGAAAVAPSRFVEEAHRLLTGASAHGTLSRFSTDVIRVLPKLRTPQAGITLRSMSHHLSADRSEVEVSWKALPSRGRGRALDDGLNLLLLPFPEEIRTTDFEAVDGRLEHLDRTRFGFFRFDPPPGGIVAKIADALAAARRQYRRVDGVVLPEAALSEGERSGVEGMLRGEKDPPFLVAGVRTETRNYAVLFDQGLGGDLPFEQDKHHRWYLDASQIRQYGLGPVLPASRRWWENMEVRRRKLTFVVVNDWLTMCPLICEDLARLDPVARLIQAVGPTLVIALLLDGPQLERRWPGRYASGLADDPGTSVLTLTALGMAVRSRPPSGGSVSRVVALWKDARTGVQEIALEPGAKGILLSLCVDWHTEWSADGREDGGAAATVVLGGVSQVRS